MGNRCLGAGAAADEEFRYNFTVRVHLAPNVNLSRFREFYIRLGVGCSGLRTSAPTIDPNAHWQIESQVMASQSVRRAEQRRGQLLQWLYMQPDVVEVECGHFRDMKRGGRVVSA